MAAVRSRSALIAFSAYTLGVATQDDFPGDPYHYAVRQAIYAVVGIAAMLAVARIDYSRFRELRVGIYTAMVLSISLVFVFAEVTRGTRGWIELPFFRFQPSELGKVLLIVALAAFALDTARRSSDARRTLRLLVLGFFPAALVLLQPDLGTALVYGAVTFAILWIAGVEMAALRGHRRECDQRRPRGRCALLPPSVSLSSSLTSRIASRPSCIQATTPPIPPTRSINR